METRNAPLHMITWRCTRRCVGSCLYCSYAPAPAGGVEVDTKTAYKIVDEIYSFGSPWFGISGGEPLVREDIFDVIDYARKISFEVSLITSGLAFSEKNLNNPVRNEVHTAVSVDGSRESNDIVRGRGNYDKALYAIKKLSENGILDCIVTTMTRYNFKDSEHPIRLAEEYGARMIVFHNLVPVGRAESNMPDLAPSSEEYEWAFNNIYPPGQVCRNGKR
jgi:MoaA/NifB/PqqE/SkfB family radical SAM enzyme